MERGLDELARVRDRSPARPLHTLFEAHEDWDDARCIRLIFEDYCDRRARCDATPAAELIAAFPEYRDALAFLLELDELVAAVALPEVGERVGEFELISHLGRGASGRVFLARETGLADRLVVVKIQPDDQDEHLSLAQVQNTHIIPLLSARALPERGLRVLCMPDLGGASLDWILADLALIPIEERCGRDIVASLHRAAGARPAPLDTDGACQQFLASETWERAACWITACLADGLDAAHRRGLVHMDLKPSNVLIAADGLPLLLDFHLARAPIAAGDRGSGPIGGTPGWMPPEQADAIDATRRGEACPQTVDHRCDVYALGQILAAILGGNQDPCGPTRITTGRARGLSAIVARCLEPAPEDRYETAAAVADDVRRFLANLPLSRDAGRCRRNAAPFAPLRRRSGSSSRLCATAGILLGFGIVVGLLACERLARVDDAIRSASEQLNRGDDVAALDSCRAARELVPPGIGGDRERRIRVLTDEAGLARQARELHSWVSSLRGRSESAADAIPPPFASAASLAGLDRLVAWSTRRGEPARSQVRSDLLELVVEIVLNDPSRATIVPKARTALGRMQVLDYVEAHANRSGSTAPVPNRNLEPAERFVLGRLLRKQGRNPEAYVLFRDLVREHPDDLGAAYEFALCALGLEEYVEAEVAFQICEALAPRSAGCSFNRGLASEKVGRWREALDGYSRAIDLDASHHLARLHRGRLNLKHSRPELAASDFERILADEHAISGLRKQAADGLSQAARRIDKLGR